MSLALNLLKMIRREGVSEQEIVISREEYLRLKSREEKLFAYYSWWFDEKNFNNYETIEDIISENIKLQEQIKNLNRQTIVKENKKLKEELREITGRRY